MMLLNAKRLKGNKDEDDLILVAIEDLTDRKLDSDGAEGRRPL
jgi:hypothetical protein